MLAGNPASGGGVNGQMILGQFKHDIENLLGGNVTEAVITVLRLSTKHNGWQPSMLG